MHCKLEGKGQTYATLLVCLCDIIALLVFILGSSLGKAYYIFEIQKIFGLLNSSPAVRGGMIKNMKTFNINCNLLLCTFVYLYDEFFKEFVLASVLKRFLA